jgi:hypothetical protein
LDIIIFAIFLIIMVILIFVSVRTRGAFWAALNALLGMLLSLMIYNDNFLVTTTGSGNETMQVINASYTLVMTTSSSQIILTSDPSILLVPIMLTLASIALIVQGTR